MWPRLLVALIEALPEESALVAALRGGGEWRGWTRTHSLLADIYDAVNVNTRATGQWKKSPPKIPPWPRPKVRRPRVTVAEIRSRFARR